MDMKKILYQSVLVGLILLMCQSVLAASFRDYSHLDPDNIVPVNLLRQAVAFYDANWEKINNQRVNLVIHQILK